MRVLRSHHLDQRAVAARIVVGPAGAFHSASRYRRRRTRARRERWGTSAGPLPVRPGPASRPAVAPRHPTPSKLGYSRKGSRVPVQSELELEDAPSDDGVINASGPADNHREERACADDKPRYSPGASAAFMAQALASGCFPVMIAATMRPKSRNFIHQTGDMP